MTIRDKCDCRLGGECRLGGKGQYAPIVLGAEVAAAADEHGSRALAISSCHPMRFVPS